MTKAQLEELRARALELNDFERAKLASDLVASLDGPVDDQAQSAWGVEICRRINKIESGSAGSLDVGEVLAGVRRKITPG